MWVYKGRTAGLVRKDALPGHPSSSAASVWGGRAKRSDRFGSARRGSAGGVLARRLVG